MYDWTIVCLLFPLTIMYLVFSSFSFNPFASGAVCYATRDLFTSPFIYQLCLCHQQMHVTVQMYKILHQAKQLQR